MMATPSIGLPKRIRWEVPVVDIINHMDSASEFSHAEW